MTDWLFKLLKGLSSLAVVSCGLEMDGLAGTRTRCVSLAPELDP